MDDALRNLRRRHTNVYRKRTMMEGPIRRRLIDVWRPQMIVASHVRCWLTDLCKTKAMRTGNVWHYLSIVCKKKACGKASSDVSWLLYAGKMQWRMAMLDIGWQLWRPKAMGAGNARCRLTVVCRTKTILELHTLRRMSDMHKPWSMHAVHNRGQLTNVPGPDQCRRSTTNLGWRLPLTVGRRHFPEAHMAWLMLPAIGRCQFT